MENGDEFRSRVIRRNRDLDCGTLILRSLKGEQLEQWHLRCSALRPSARSHIAR